MYQVYNFCVVEITKVKENVLPVFKNYYLICKECIFTCRCICEYLGGPCVGLHSAVIDVEVPAGTLSAKSDPLLLAISFYWLKNENCDDNGIGSSTFQRDPLCKWLSPNIRHSPKTDFSCWALFHSTLGLGHNLN